MSEPEDKTKLDSEVHLFETPTPKVRNDVSRRAQPQSPVTSGLNHVIPPSRDGKVRKVDSSGGKKKNFRAFLMIIAAALGAILLMNYREVASKTYQGMATIDLLNRNLDSAALHYKDAYFINPNDVSSLLLAASIHLGQKKEQLAQEEFALVLKNTKDLPTAYNQRAKILNGMGRSEEALADWTEAIKLKPEYFAAHAQRANIYLSRNDYEKALPDLEVAVRLNPNKEDNRLEIEYKAVKDVLENRAKYKANPH